MFFHHSFVLCCVHISRQQFLFALTASATYFLFSAIVGDKYKNYNVCKVILIALRQINQLNVQYVFLHLLHYRYFKGAHFFLVKH